MRKLQLTLVFLLPGLLAAQGPPVSLRPGEDLGRSPIQPGQSRTGPATASAVEPSNAAPVLTRQEAERIALANNPRIKVGLLVARAQAQAVRVRRADELPNLTGNVTAVEANEASRISSGSLTASRLLQHVGLGVQLN